MIFNSSHQTWKIDRHSLLALLQCNIWLLSSSLTVTSISKTVDKLTEVHTVIIVVGLGVHSSETVPAVDCNIFINLDILTTLEVITPGREFKPSIRIREHHL